MKPPAPGKKRVVLFAESPFVDCNRRMAIGMLNNPGMGPERYLSIIRPPETARKMRTLLDRAKPDAVASLDLSRECLDVVIEAGIPCVQMSFDAHPTANIPVIRSDDVRIGAMAADSLLRRGCQNLAVLASRTWPQFKERVEGFLDRLGKERCPVLWSDECDAQPLFEFPVKPAQIPAWLRKLPKPVAVFCVNDTTGAMLIQLCADMGFRVPEDVAVLGVDNSNLFCLTVSPALSSVVVPFEEMGRRAAELLAQENFPRKRKVELLAPLEVVSRGSTALHSSVDPVVSGALAYIAGNIEKPFHIRDITARLRVSGQTLSERFKASLGHTAIEEVRLQRVEHAKNLLLSEISVTEVYRRSGFRSAAHFSKAFRELTGRSPTEFRRHAAAS